MSLARFLCSAGGGSRFISFSETRAWQPLKAAPSKNQGHGTPGPGPYYQLLAATRSLSVLCTHQNWGDLRRSTCMHVRQYEYDDPQQAIKYQLDHPKSSKHNKPAGSAQLMLIVPVLLPAGPAASRRLKQPNISSCCHARGCQLPCHRSLLRPVCGRAIESQRRGW